MVLYIVFLVVTFATVLSGQPQIASVSGYAVMAIIVLAAHGIGEHACSAIGIAAGRWVERRASAIAAGLIPLWLLPLLLARLGILRPRWLLALLCALSLLGIPAAWRAIRERPSRSSPRSPISLAAVIILLMLALYAAHTLLPAVFFDGLSYHLAVPNQYLVTGKLLFIPYTQGANYPMGGEFLALYGLSVGDDGALKKINFLFLILVVLIVGEALPDRRKARLAQLILLASPLMGFMATLEFIDLPLVLYLLLCVLALIRSADASTARSPVLAAGIWAGAAMSIKYSAIPFLLATAALWLIRSWRSWRRLLAPALGAALLSLLVPLAWYAKSYAHTGNPVFPYLNRVFASPYAASQPAAEDDAHGYRKDRGRFSLWHIMRYPFDVSTQPYRGGMLADPGVLFLALLPLLALKRPRRGLETDAILYAILFFAVWWVLTGYLVRYVAVIFPLLSIPLGRATEEALNDRRTLRIAVTATLIAGITLNMMLYLGQMNFYFKSLTYLTGGMTHDQLLDSTVTYHRVADFANKNLPAEARILFVAERRSFYFQRECLVQNYFVPNTLVALLEQTSDDEMVRARLKKQGFTHILLYEKHLADVAARFPATIPPALVPRIEAFCAWNQRIYADSYYVLCRL